MLKDASSCRRCPAPAGKLVRCLVKAGDHVDKGQAYAEVEVMKMMMPLLSPAAGKISFQASEGAPLMAGELIATLDLVRLGWVWGLLRGAAACCYARRSGGTRPQSPC